jgi:hypothetical protein
LRAHCPFERLAEEGASIFRKFRVGMKFPIDKTFMVVYNVNRSIRDNRIRNSKDTLLSIPTLL